jgi:hypothetical protein
MNATIPQDQAQKVDAAIRTVVLKSPDGTTKSYKLGPELRNFDQIKVGDTVKATVVDAVGSPQSRAARAAEG